MGFAAWGVYGLLSKVLVGMDAFRVLAGDGVSVSLSYTGNALAAVIAIGVAVVVYAVLIVVTRAISRDDLSLMPKGEKIAKLLRIR